MKKLKPIEHVVTYLIPEKGDLGLEAPDANYGVFLIALMFLTMFLSNCSALATSLRDLCSGLDPSCRSCHNVVISKAVYGQDLGESAQQEQEHSSQCMGEGRGNQGLHSGC